MQAGPGRRHSAAAPFPTAHSPLQVMALIGYLWEQKRMYGPHLIIVPNAVLLNWRAELEVWLPAAKCSYYIGEIKERTLLWQ